MEYGQYQHNNDVTGSFRCIHGLICELKSRDDAIADLFYFEDLSDKAIPIDLGSKKLYTIHSDGQLEMAKMMFCLLESNGDRLLITIRNNGTFRCSHVCL